MISQLLPRLWLCGLLLCPAATLQAQESENTSEAVREARLEGSIWMAFALNRSLNPFQLNADVEGRRATLTGRVESDTERELAERVALGVDGIEAVVNRIDVDADVERRPRPDVASRFDDATITATIKSRLLWNRETEGLDIDVETEGGAVTLSGRSQSAAGKQAAERLAQATRGVHAVHNHIEVSSAASTADRVEDAAVEARSALGDVWISGKVKTSLLYDRRLDGVDIKVDSQDGVVRLAGRVADQATKDHAIAVAQAVRGVHRVEAEQLIVER